MGRSNTTNNLHPMPRRMHRGRSFAVGERNVFRVSRRQRGNDARHFGRLTSAQAQPSDQPLTCVVFSPDAGLLWGSCDTAMASRFGRPLGAVADEIPQSGLGHCHACFRSGFCGFSRQELNAEWFLWMRTDCSFNHQQLTDTLGFGANSAWRSPMHRPI